MKDRTGKPIEKLTSKKDLTVSIIKKHLIENKFQEGDVITPTRELAEIADSSTIFPLTDTRF